MRRQPSRSSGTATRRADPSTAWSPIETFSRMSGDSESERGQRSTACDGRGAGPRDRLDHRVEVLVQVDVVGRFRREAAVGDDPAALARFRSPGQRRRLPHASRPAAPPSRAHPSQSGARHGCRPELRPPPAPRAPRRSGTPRGEGCGPGPARRGSIAHDGLRIMGRRVALGRDPNAGEGTTPAQCALAPAVARVEPRGVRIHAGEPARGRRAKGGVPQHEGEAARNRPDALLPVHAAPRVQGQAGVDGAVPERVEPVDDRRAALRGSLDRADTCSDAQGLRSWPGSTVSALPPRTTGCRPLSSSTLR